jgi:hypothetical protein
MSSGETPATRAMLDAWRECGADRLDPMRFRFIEALERRAAAHSGEARRILDHRLSELLEAYAGDLERAAAGTRDAAGAVSRGVPARGALAGLVDYIANPAPATGEATTADHAERHARARTYPELEWLEHFREIWSKLSAEQQVRQSLEQVPGNAGPLNSSSLVHRSLALMRELSPGYLQQFLSYVDALSWMEQISGGAIAAGKDAPRPASTKKSARGKAR